MVDEQDALEVVHLMLQAGGQHAIGLHLDLLAVQIEIFRPDAGGALHIVPDFRDRQAALLENGHLFRRPENLGVDEDAPTLLAVFLIQIYHDHPLGHADLDRRQADAVGGIHAVGHVFDQFADFAIHLFDISGDGFKPRVGRDKDRTDGHGREIGEAGKRVKQRMEFAVIVLGVAIVVAALILAFARGRAAPRDPRLDSVLSGQGDITGQFRQTVAAQEALSRTLAERLEALDKRLGQSLSDNASKTAATIAGIGERLTVIDEAQKNISALSGQVVSLQQVLSNKQARGAFAQTQMEEIVRDGLPVSLYDFQFTLSNRNRPDCVIRIPGAKALVVVDAKFPLECFELLRRAATDDERKTAQARVRGDVGKHVTDIAGKYLIAGEVQDPALMFVPSESIYAELHDSFSDVIQKAHRAHVMVVSPNILMLALNTIQTIMKDARMREQADLIRKEVGILVGDVKRLGERVGNLQRHFDQAEADLKAITVSTDKIISRGEKIENAELASPEQGNLL